jgi:hypothetical protein
VWYLEPAYVRARGDALKQITAEIKTLQANKQYEGRQLLRSEFRSFDRQSAGKAVVTVRETWQDALYEYDDYPAQFGATPVKERGPYTLDVTYTLERGEYGWEASRIVYANQPPKW